MIRNLYSITNFKNFSKGWPELNWVNIKNAQLTQSTNQRHTKTNKFINKTKPSNNKKTTHNNNDVPLYPLLPLLPLSTLSLGLVIIPIDKEPPGDVIPRLILLFLALITIPLFGQVLLLNAIQMEPLPFAVRVLAHHHLPEGSTAAVTISGFFGVVRELGGKGLQQGG